MLFPLLEHREPKKRKRKVCVSTDCSSSHMVCLLVLALLRVWQMEPEEAYRKCSSDWTLINTCVHHGGRFLLLDYPALSLNVCFHLICGHVTWACFSHTHHPPPHSSPHMKERLCCKIYKKKKRRRKKGKTKPGFCETSDRQREAHCLIHWAPS